MNEQVNTNTGVEHIRLEHLVNVVEDILDDVRGKKDLHLLEIPDLESEEYAAQRRNQSRRGLKILMPNQMLSRLPISLTQLKVGNNSEKLKNETLGKDQNNLQNNSIKV